MSNTTPMRHGCPGVRYLDIDAFYPTIFENGLPQLVRVHRQNTALKRRSGTRFRVAHLMDCESKFHPNPPCDLGADSNPSHVDTQ